VRLATSLGNGAPPFRGIKKGEENATAFNGRISGTKMVSGDRWGSIALLREDWVGGSFLAIVFEQMGRIAESLQMGPFGGGIDPANSAFEIGEEDVAVLGSNAKIFREAGFTLDDEEAMGRFESAVPAFRRALGLAF
jgi:hypothetical protein